MVSRAKVINHKENAEKELAAVRSAHGNDSDGFEGIGWTSGFTDLQQSAQIAAKHTSQKHTAW